MLCITFLVFPLLVVWPWFVLSTIWNILFVALVLCLLSLPSILFRLSAGSIGNKNLGSTNATKGHHVSYAFILLHKINQAFAPCFFRPLFASLFGTESNCSSTTTSDDLHVPPMHALPTKDNAICTNAKAIAPVAENEYGEDPGSDSVHHQVSNQVRSNRATEINCLIRDAPTLYNADEIHISRESEPVQTKQAIDQMATPRSCSNPECHSGNSPDDTNSDHLHDNLTRSFTRKACLVCTDTKYIAPLLKCGHDGDICSECVIHHLSNKLHSNGITDMNCLYHDCVEVYNLEDIHMHGGYGLARKIAFMQAHQSIDQMLNNNSCSKPECESSDLNDDINFEHLHVQPRLDLTLNECLVCTDIKEIVSVLPCGHDANICSDCVLRHLSNQVNSNRTTHVNCLLHECREMYNSEHVRKHGGIELAREMESVQSVQAIEQMPNFRRCHRAECGSGQLHDDFGGTLTIMNCIKCSAQTCTYHQMEWHTGMTCKEYDRKMKRMRRRGWMRRMVLLMHSRKDDVGEVSIDKVMKKMLIKACPKCGQGVQKNGGCNHVS